MLRRTKILATLGPATESRENLEALLQAGVDVVRLNFSHGSHDFHREQVKKVRAISQEIKRSVGILADLQGPKIRIARFKDKKVQLANGAAFALDASLDSDSGDSTQVGIDYKALPSDVSADDILLLDDGRIELLVQQVVGDRIECTVTVGGELSDNKGINRKGGGLSATALTDKDKADLKVVAEADIDMVAISFPRSAEDILQAKALLAEHGAQSIVIAKIERAEAITNLDEIIEASDGIMVARGDLGVEIGDAELPGEQKRMISRARSADKLVITATQMMESMIQNTIPTRAEVFDVANAVLDGTDAVMLSAETAVGLHPAKVIEAVDRICIGAEKERATQISTHRVSRQFDRIDEAIAMAAMYTANHTGVKAIITFTESGASPLWMSRINSSIPIFGFSRHVATLRKMTLYRGVFPVYFNVTMTDSATMGREAVAELMARGLVNKGDKIIITRGDILGVHGGTNRLKIVEAGESRGLV